MWQSRSFSVMFIIYSAVLVLMYMFSWVYHQGWGSIYIPYYDLWLGNYLHGHWMSHYICPLQLCCQIHLQIHQ